MKNYLGLLLSQFCGVRTLKIGQHFVEFMGQESQEYILLAPFDCICVCILYITSPAL